MSKENIKTFEEHEDTKRLTWMTTHSARVSWSIGGQKCRVIWMDTETQDEYITSFFDSPRAAIDSAMKSECEA